MLTWKECYSVNIKEIDLQHQKLIELINQLEGAMLMGVGADALESIYAGMIRYAKEHFATEEKLMADHGFPDFEWHAKEHEHFIRKVHDMEQQRKAGSTGLTVRTLTFLCDWLSHHIMSTDHKYSAYLNERGVH